MNKINLIVYGLLSFIIFYIIVYFSFDFFKFLLIRFDLLMTADNKIFLSILFTCIGSFGVGIIYFILRINEKNIKLTSTLNELKFQKKALDEHAIVSKTDSKGNITYVNDKFCEISGYTREELIGQNHRILKSDEHDRAFFDNLKKTILAGKVWHGEVKNRSKSGRDYWVRATIVPILDINNKVSSFVSVRTDITEAKEIQSKLLIAKEDVEASNKAKNEFLANMSHELKTPLNSINLISSTMLKNKDLTLIENDLNKIEVINKSGKHLLELINDVLDIAKIDAHEISVTCEEFNFKELILKLEEKFQKRLELSSLFLDIDVDENLNFIYNDKNKIKKIIYIILDNAIKFTNKGRITLRVSSSDNELTIKIADEGIGIAENKLLTIFDRFTQIDGSIARKYTGTGLGLSICKELVTLLNGSISVESKLTLGTTFTISIDKNFSLDDKTSEKEKLEEKEIIIPKINNTNEETDKNKNKLDFNILILNNDPINLFNIVVNLKRFANRVESTNKTNDFFKLLKSNEFDKIIIDIDNYNDEIIYKILKYTREIYIISDNIIKDDIKNNIKELINKHVDFETIVNILNDKGKK